MTVLLSRSYGGYPAGNTIQVPTNVENAIISNNIGTVVATTASAATTTGAVTTSLPAGRVSRAAGSSSVGVTHSSVDVNSKIWACINQATADTTLLRVERVVPGAGSFTIYGTANATATTVIDWAILRPWGGVTTAL